MRRAMAKGLSILTAITVGATPLWAHPSTSFHVHADEVAGLVVVSLLVVGLLGLAGRKQR